MNFKETIFPLFIKNHIRLLKKKKMFIGRIIKTPNIGENVQLGKSCGVYENVTIGKDVTINDYSFVNTGTNVGSGTIGKFTSIGSNCQIGMPEHPTTHATTSPFIYQNWRSVAGVESDLYNEFQAPPSIGNDVWIGSNSVVLQGVHIGDGAIIGAGAVVTKDIPPYSIVGGVPAKVIKKRFSDEKISYLVNLKWWDMSEDELKNYKNFFESKELWFELNGGNKHDNDIQFTQQEEYRHVSSEY